MLYITHLEIKSVLTKMFKLKKGYECHLNCNISAVQYFAMHMLKLMIIMNMLLMCLQCIGVQLEIKITIFVSFRVQTPIGNTACTYSPHHT